MFARRSPGRRRLDAKAGLSLPQDQGHLLQLQEQRWRTPGLHEAGAVAQPEGRDRAADRQLAHRRGQVSQSHRQEEPLRQYPGDHRAADTQPGEGPAVWTRWDLSHREYILLGQDR